MNYLAAILYLLFVCHSVVVPSLEAVETEAVHSKTSSLSYLHGLLGSRKGDHVKGIKHLKRQMKRLGYLNSDQNIKGNKFDENLELAIKTYQQNFHLSDTGMLDVSTVEKMLVPRCGCPDVIHGANVMLHRPNQPSSPIHVNFTFIYGPLRWPPSKYNLTYKFVNDFLDPVISIVAVSAFAKWSAVSSFTFTRVSSSSDADLTIGGFSGDHGDGSPFDGRGGILAHAFAPMNGRLHMDSDERWSMDPRRDEVDMESVFIHEVGHLLGLGHTDIREAIMYPILHFGERKRFLHTDDVVGLQLLYS